MASKLLGLEITSVDLVDAGANPEAFIMLYKSKDPKEDQNTEQQAKNLHPDVKKALDEVEEMKKSALAEIEKLKNELIMEKLTGIAKKYEVLGKNPDDLALKLFTLKKAAKSTPDMSCVYNDYIALLDEQLDLIEKSGLFSELGLNTQASLDVRSEIEKAASILRHENPGLTYEAAFTLACEQNPELLKEYEKGLSD